MRCCKFRKKDRLFGSFSRDGLFFLKNIFLRIIIYRKVLQTLLMIKSLPGGIQLFYLF